MPPIEFETFLEVDIRVGRIVRAEPFPEARKSAFRLWVDLGEELGMKQSSAQITDHYTPESLEGRLVLVVANLPPRQIGPFRSDVLVLGVPDTEGAIVLVAPDTEVPLGGRMH